jgi:hypothetical protein
MKHVYQLGYVPVKVHTYLMARCTPIAASVLSTSAPTTLRGTPPLVRRPSSARCDWLERTDPPLWWDSRDALDWYENADATDIHEPIEPAEAKEKMLPIDAIEPALPREAIESWEPTERMEFSDHRDHMTASVVPH